MSRALFSSKFVFFLSFSQVNIYDYSFNLIFQYNHYNKEFLLLDIIETKYDIFLFIFNKGIKIIYLNELKRQIFSSITYFYEFPFLINYTIELLGENSYKIHLEGFCYNKFFQFNSNFRVNE